MKYIIWHKLIYLILITLSFFLFFIGAFIFLIMLFAENLPSDLSGLFILPVIIMFISSVLCFSGNQKVLKSFLNCRIDTNKYVSEILCALIRIAFCYLIASVVIQKGNYSILILSPITLSLWLPLALFFGLKKIPLIFPFCVLGLELFYAIQLTRLKLGKAPIGLSQKDRSVFELAHEKLLEITNYPFNMFVAGEKSLKEILWGKPKGEK